ncbi:MAG: DUF1624 domain-containing protein [Bacteroidetes bacterium]|nr:DUF1624 domain-containing protein [Bacteroidota bacterium]
MMKSNSNKVAHFNGISFALLFFAVASAFVIPFITVGGIFSMVDVKKMQIPVYFAYFDWIPAVFLFVLGVGLAIQSKNKSQSSQKLRVNTQRKGALLLGLGLLFAGTWGMNLFIILGASFIIGSWLLRLDSLTIHVASLAIILLSLVLVNLDVPFKYKYFVFDVQVDGVAKLLAFVGFNGYYSIFPWVALFLSGLAVGKGVLRPRGFFPPTSFIALFIIVLGYMTNIYCIDLYAQMDSFSAKFLYPFDQFLYQPSFVMINIGLGWLIINFLNHLFEIIGERSWITLMKELATSKLTVLFLIYSMGSLFMMGFAYSGTIVIGFAHPYLLSTFLILALSAIFWSILFWKRKVNKNAPLEWLIKYISSKDNSGK